MLPANSAVCCTRLVIDTLTEASKEDPNRKCFRLIGGVLVERTVKEVLPALQTNLEGVSFAGFSHAIAPRVATC